MKVRITQDAHHRVSSAVSQAFRAQTEANVPRATAAALIARGVAEAITEAKPSSKGDQ